MMGRLFVKYFAAFLITLSLLFSVMIGMALVPRNAVRKNMMESAEYLGQGQSIFRIRSFLNSSMIDHYADTITISIAFYLDEKHPITSTMWTSFNESQTTINEALVDTLLDDTPANKEYLRYWHGSAAIIRFLHLVWNIKQIYLFHAVFMMFLYFILSYILLKNEMLPETIAFTLSIIIVSIWYVPLCLEYTWMFLVMLAASIISVRLTLNLQWEKLCLSFMVTGMIAAYVDFLTTETLTLLIPQLLILRIQSRQGMNVNWRFTMKTCFLWGVGFVGMWISKWVLASIFLSQNVMPYVTGHIERRLAGNVGLTTWEYIYQAIIKNLKCLFPYEYGLSGAVLVFVFFVFVVILPVVTDKVVLRKGINKRIIAIFSLLSLIPFIRFVVLRNHSFIHFYFTYRALASTVLALSFIILELVQLNPRKAVMKNA